VPQGGGNLGPCVEYFIEGMEVGNMVFMQFKTFPNGTWEPLKVAFQLSPSPPSPALTGVPCAWVDAPDCLYYILWGYGNPVALFVQVQVIDVGIGLERIPFLVNGSPTSYTDVFPEVLEFLQGRLGISFNSEIWTKYGPYACLLNIDECEDINATWELIAQKISPFTRMERGKEGKRNFARHDRLIFAGFSAQRESGEPRTSRVTPLMLTAVRRTLAQTYLGRSFRPPWNPSVTSSSSRTTRAPSRSPSTTARCPARPAAAPTCATCCAASSTCSTGAAGGTRPASLAFVLAVP